MIPPKQFETTNDESHLEQWEHLFDYLLNVMEYSKFLFERNWLAVIVEYTPENVPKFDHSHHFFDKVFADSIENLLEKRSVVDQLESELELELETVPNRMVFLFFLRWLQCHLIF